MRNCLRSVVLINDQSDNVCWQPKRTKQCIDLGTVTWCLRGVVLAIFASLFSTPSVAANDSPLGGFLPFVGMALSDEFKNSGGGEATFFISDPSNSAAGQTLLSGSASPFFDIALLDTGAATHILGPDASGPNGYDVIGNGFGGTNIQPIGGATGTIDLMINDPHGVYIAGLGSRTSAGTDLTIDVPALRGQTTFATLSGPTEWTLPNIIGLPIAAQHTIRINNSQPQIFELGSRTVRTPDVEMFDLGTGSQQGIQRRLPLDLQPGGIGFIQGPLYVFNTSGILSGLPLHENPQSPSVIENGAIFVDVDMKRGTKSLDDTGMLFDTGADLTVISELTAVRLGFDPILDTPDFVLQVEGSGGIVDGIPGFYLNELNFDTIGGSFTKQNVPVAVLDVTNPSNPGNIVPGIIGMHLFNGRDLVIDTNPSVGQGGVGPSVYISDPVTSDHQWSTHAASGPWSTAGNWTTAGVPASLWITRVANVSGSHQTAVVDSDSTVFRTVVSGQPSAGMTIDILSGNELTVFADVTIEDDGQLHLSGGELDAQFVQMDGGMLSGSGNIFVGSGPIHTAVRNGAGVVAPGNTSGNAIGMLDINGDFAQASTGTLEIELAGTAVAGVDYDQITASRAGFLNGTLDVSLANHYTPQIGDSFEILTAGESLSGVFETLTLPNGFQWDVVYDPVQTPVRVLLEVTALSLIGDFNASGQYDPEDIDMLYAQIPGSSPPADASYDLTGDGSIDQADVDELVLQLMNRRYGDADLDQDIDITDFNSLSSHFDPSGIHLRWDNANFDGDGDVDITDFNTISNNFAPDGYNGNAIPEPSTIVLWLFGSLVAGWMWGATRGLHR